MNVQDIEGTLPKQVRKLISSKNSEIAEAKVGSYKRGISTKRITNPLKPDYVYIGSSENKNNYAMSRPKTAAQRLDTFINK